MIFSVQNTLLSMASNRYANYTLQKMLDAAEPAQKKIIIEKITPVLPLLIKFPHSRAVLTKVEEYRRLLQMPIGPFTHVA